MSKIVHIQSGDEPITIRSLVQIAEREGWDLGTRLATYSDLLGEEHVVRGVARVPGVFGDSDLRIDLDLVPEEEWKVRDDSSPDEDRADRISGRVLEDMA